jgi:hypothetical protein
MTDIENEIKLQALETRLDEAIDRINHLTRFIEQPKAPSFLTIKDVAEMAGLSRKTIETDIAENRLKVVHRGKRKVVTQKAADEYLNK